MSGGGSKYLRWGYNSHAKYKATGYCNVDEENFGFWEPLEQGAKTPDDATASLSGKRGPQ